MGGRRNNNKIKIFFYGGAEFIFNFYYFCFLKRVFFKEFLQFFFSILEFVNFSFFISLGHFIGSQTNRYFAQAESFLHKGPVSFMQNVERSADNNLFKIIDHFKCEFLGIRMKKNGKTMSLRQQGIITATKTIKKAIIK